MKLFVADAPLTVDEDGERRIVPPGEVLSPALVASWSPNGLHSLIAMEKVRVIDLDEVAALTEQYQQRFGDPATGAKTADPSVLVLTAADAPKIDELGVAMVKLPHPVMVAQVDEVFQVETNEGLMNGHPGGFVVHDPVSGHVWPVSADYVAAHYVPHDPGPGNDDGDTQTTPAATAETQTPTKAPAKAKPAAKPPAAPKTAQAKTTTAKTATAETTPKKAPARKPPAKTAAAKKPAAAKA